MNIAKMQPNLTSMVSKRALAIWLALLGLGIFGMIILGGATRLTDSGLSMVDWRPILGTFPPMSTSAWETTFGAYKATPQFQKVNMSMTLHEFKGIFYWEYFHRLAGRLLGLLALLPYLWWGYRGKLDLKWQKRGALIIALIVAQGLMGWIMVKSGLVDMPRVSHFRLAAHFSLALSVFSVVIWSLLELRPSSGERLQVPRPLRVGTKWVLGGLILQLIYGAFVAGTRAGYMYNTFPKMGDHFMAPAVWNMTPAWVNFLSNPFMVQFIHRWLGALIFIGVWVLFGSAIKLKLNNMFAIHYFGLALLTTCQYMLGIFTLLFKVPLPLGLMHQGLGAILLGVMVMIVFDLRRAR